jgi:hypothetical protein
MTAPQIAHDYFLIGLSTTGIVLLLVKKEKLTPLEVLILITFYPIVFHHTVRYLKNRKNGRR